MQRRGSDVRGVQQKYAELNLSVPFNDVGSEQNVPA
jgi:hypothetical protein